MNSITLNIKSKGMDQGSIEVGYFNGEDFKDFKIEINLD